LHKLFLAESIARLVQLVSEYSGVLAGLLSLEKSVGSLHLWNLVVGIPTSLVEISKLLAARPAVDTSSTHARGTQLGHVRSFINKLRLSDLILLGSELLPSAAQV